MRYLGTAGHPDNTNCPVISRVEQLVGSGDTLLAVGSATRHHRDGTFGGIAEGVTVRLTSTERQELIRALSEHHGAVPTTAADAV